MAHDLCCKTEKAELAPFCARPRTAAVGSPANEVQRLPTKLGEGQAVQLAAGAAQGGRPLLVCDRLVQQANALRHWEVNGFWKWQAVAI